MEHQNNRLKSLCFSLLGKTIQLACFVWYEHIFTLANSFHDAGDAEFAKDNYDSKATLSNYLAAYSSYRSLYTSCRTEQVRKNLFVVADHLANIGAEKAPSSHFDKYVRTMCELDCDSLKELILFYEPAYCLDNCTPEEIINVYKNLLISRFN